MATFVIPDVIHPSNLTVASRSLHSESLLATQEELVAPCRTPKLKDNPLSAVCDYLFNVFAATFNRWGRYLHPQTEEAP
jgi:hypothetical protein